MLRGGGPLPDPELEARYAGRAPRQHHVDLRIAGLIIAAVIVVAAAAAIIRLT